MSFQPPVQTGSTSSASQYAALKDVCQSAATHRSVFREYLLTIANYKSSSSASTADGGRSPDILLRGGTDQPVGDGVALERSTGRKRAHDDDTALLSSNGGGGGVHIVNSRIINPVLDDPRLLLMVAYLYPRVYDAALAIALEAGASHSGHVRDSTGGAGTNRPHAGAPRIYRASTPSERRCYVVTSLDLPALALQDGRPSSQIRQHNSGLTGEARLTEILHNRVGGPPMAPLQTTHRGRDPDHNHFVVVDEDRMDGSSSVCSCYAFTYQVHMREETALCKHALAVYIRIALERFGCHSVGIDTIGAHKYSIPALCLSEDDWAACLE